MKEIFNKYFDPTRIVEKKWILLVLKISTYIGIAAYLIKMSWYAWADILLDYGEELYIPWRISEGAVLYRDMINNYFGPLPFYLNALWFHLLGTSITTLIVVSLFILVLLVWLIEDWLKTITNPLSVFVSGIIFIGIFAFGRYTENGNYDYLTPYSYGLVLGFVTIMGLLSCLKRWGNNKKFIWLIPAGLLLGSTVINKIEIFIPAVAIVLSYFGTELVIDFKNKARIILGFLTTCFIGLVPPLVTIYLFSKSMPVNEAFKGIFGQFILAFNGGLAQMNSLPFYKTSLGTNDILGNSLRMLGWSWIWFNMALVGIFISLSLKNIRPNRLLIWIIFSLTGVLEYLLIPNTSWFEIARSFPVLILAGFGISLWLALKRRPDHQQNWPMLVTSFVLAGTFLLKMPLNSRIYHYGFVLGVPATLLAVVALTDWLPRYLERYNIGRTFKIFFLVTFSVMVVKDIGISSANYSKNTFDCCGTDINDTLIVDQKRGPIIEDTVNELKRRLGPNETFSVLPRGIMLNYLLRRPDPTKVIFAFGDLLSFSEDDIINSYSKNPPDFIVYLHLDTNEHGFRFFGHDIGVKLYNWVNKNYNQVWQEGGTPFEAKTKFAATILQKKLSINSSKK